MAKELPYFQFEPAEYLTRDVSFCSMSAQGLFVNICSFYWQRNCDLSLQQIERRFNYPNELAELVQEGVVDVQNDKIIVKFLLAQYQERVKTSDKNKLNGSKGGRPKQNQNETQLKANSNPTQTQLKANSKPTQSQTKGIIKEEIREEKKKEDERREEKKKTIPPLDDFLNFVFLIPEFSTKREALTFSVTAKYDEWVANGWKDGFGKKIINWKLKIKNTLPFLKEIKNGTKQEQEQPKQLTFEERIAARVERMFPSDTQQTSNEGNTIEVRGQVLGGFSPVKWE
jgi:hypothetical protein